MPGGGGGGGRPPVVHAPAAPAAAPSANLAVDDLPWAAPPHAEPPVMAPPPPVLPQSFPEVVALLKERRESVLAGYLEASVHLVRFDAAATPPRFEFRPQPGVPADLAQRIGKFLLDATETRWMVTVNTTEPGEPTLREQTRGTVSADPLVQALLRAFPDAHIGMVRPKKKQEAEVDETAPVLEDSLIDTSGDDDA